MPIRPDREVKSPELQQIGGRLLTWMAFFLILNLLLFRASSTDRIPYSEFVDQVKAGKVARALIAPDQIEYELKSDQSGDQTGGQAAKTYITTPVATDLQLPDILRSHQVEFSAPPSLGWLGTILSWVLPLLIFLGLWSWLLNRGQAGGAALTIGQSKARIYSQGSIGVKFEDVAGIDEAKAELQEIVDFLKNADKYTRLGAKIPKGVLLVGPPGTGKTLLAKAIAGEASVPFFSISGSEFIELFVGVGAARVRDLFEQAKRQAPCIVFIDELDALGKSRASVSPMQGGNDEREQTLNQLLSEMDGFDPNTGVILLAATNRPEVLDPALRRPGRFDRQIVIDRPDKIGREAILTLHAKTVKLSIDVNFSRLAAQTPGFAGADLANLVNEAALLAARENHDMVMMADFNQALERVVAGLEKKSRVLNELEKTIVAYHEVGHALIAVLMPGAGSVEKISVVPRGVGALGYTLQLPEEDRFLMTEDEIRGRIVTLLGGRSAEEIIFDRTSTGASDDLQKATDMAERFVTLYGMSDTLGLVVFDRTPQPFLEGFSNPRRSISSKVAEEIDHAVKHLIDGAHVMALAILGQNRALLDETAQMLLDHEVLEGQELKAFLDRVQAPDTMPLWLQTGEPCDRPPASASVMSSGLLSSGALGNGQPMPANHQS